MKSNSLLVFGDSITYGAYDNECGGWVNRLRLDLENNYLQSYTVFNLGISGQTTSDVLTRLESEIVTRYDENKNTIVVFAVGINDTQMINGKERISIVQFSNNIRELISIIRNFTENIVFVGLSIADEKKTTPIPWNKDKSYLNSRIRSFDNEIEKICKEEKVEYIEIWKSLSLFDLEDGLHPNSMGHQKLKEEIKKSLLD